MDWPGVLAKPARAVERGGVPTPASLAEAKRLLLVDPAAAARLVQAMPSGGTDAAATLLLATALRRAGDPAPAHAIVAPLAASQPRAWGVQFELGMALSAVGEVRSALAALRRAREIKPDALLATHALWDLAIVTGEPEAREPRPPLDVLASSRLEAAAGAFLEGDSSALSQLANAFGLDPNDCAAACVIAEVGMRLGKLDAVATLMRDAVRRAPGHGPAAFRLAEALHRRADDAAALDVLAPLSTAAGRGAAVAALEGATLMSLNRAEAAVDALADAVALAPGDVGVRLAHGHALRAIGRPKQAVEGYRTALAISPTCAEAYWSIADLNPAALTDDDVAAMSRLLDEAALPPRPRSHLYFAAGRAMEGAAQYVEAFRHYLNGNQLRRKLEPFDVAAHEAAVERAVDLSTPGFFATRVGWGDPDGAPIFVVGMPRSGSTLVERILSGHSAIEGASELPDLPAVARAVIGGASYPDALSTLPPGELTTAGTIYLTRAASRRHTARPRFVDKYPGNVFHLPLILLALPNARVIDIRRDSRDCCVSLFATSFAAGQSYSYDLAQLGRVYASYVRLADHLTEVLPGRILRVSYEDVVDDPEAETRRMLDHLGLAFEPECLRFHERSTAVRTASSEQVRRPLYRTSIGRWRRFASFLGPLNEALGIDQPAP